MDAKKFVDHVIVTDELGREYWKPHPRAFELMKDQLGIEYNEMIYAGDNPEKDFYIRNIHPIHTCRIIGDGLYINKEYFANIKEEYTIESFKQLRQIIEEP